MKKFISIIAGLALSASAALAGEYADIDIEALKEKIEAEEVIVIDVNGDRSFSRAHIPGAINFAAVGADGLAEAIGEANKDKLVVAYCGGPTCSAYQRGATAAEELGFTNIKHLSAGISGWLAANQPTEAAEAE